MSYSNESPYSPPLAVTSFSVQTDAEPTTLARVLEVFALREVMPARFHSVVDPLPLNEPNTGRLNVDIQVAGLAPEAAEAIARKLAAVIGVRSVLTEGPATCSG